MIECTGYKQRDWSHHYSASIVAHLNNPTAARVMLTFLCMNLTWLAVLIDVEWAFLQGTFENGMEQYIKFLTYLRHDF